MRAFQWPAVTRSRISVCRTGRELLPVMPDEEDEPEAMTDEEGNVTSLSGRVPADRGERGGEERR